METQEPQAAADAAPPLRPEAFVYRGDRTLAAMVLLVCTLGGVGIGFGAALYMLRVSAPATMLAPVPRKCTTLTWLGAQLDPNAEVQGAKIIRVFDSSPAERAGLQQGDVVLRLDDAWVSSSDDLVREVRDRDPGDRALLLVDRNGRTIKVRAFLASF